MSVEHLYRVEYQIRHLASGHPPSHYNWTQSTTTVTADTPDQARERVMGMISDLMTKARILRVTEVVDGQD